ncbi:FERRY endosomal RAB5 effector complex subunit 3 [Lycorma delicatula]|uniref:FERRY endosomal RAB5 effector complex subunit 3 n=1 Tax=Lycorma delicatula TaxID=130591 RepID=UPI003F514834
MSFEEDNSKKKQKLFKFTFPMETRSDEFILEIPIHIPYSGHVGELVHRILNSFKLPAYLEKDLELALKCFIGKETVNYYDELSENEINNALDGTTDVEDIIKIWEKSFKENTVEFGEKLGTNDSELFSAVYHKLVHSPALETILQVEHTYALAVADIARERDLQVSSLNTKQSDEMCRAVDGINITSTEAEINDLAGRHLEQQSLVHAQWDSQVDAIKEAQRRQYRDWVMDRQTNNTTPLSSPISSLANQTFLDRIDAPVDSVGPILQESFTIHLGSQMKQMHNIRILSADILDFCRLKHTSLNSGDPQPQRLQTALGLYSNDLCGIVLLTDTHIGSHTGLLKEFVDICESSTEFHFPSMTEQLETVKDTIKEGVEWRKNHQPQDCPNQLLNLTTSEQLSRRSGTKYLQTGDVFLTRHSNLAEIHVVFHMIVDDSLRSSDINSRHPAILGLRNILKTACSNDITIITLPVLLMHEMTEEMTVNWCTKRAELVFKCVKGFMIEMASWGGSDLKNLQFLVPKGISEDVFSSLATMLPSIFRVSNPLVFKATSWPVTAKNKHDKNNSKK